MVRLQEDALPTPDNELLRWRIVVAVCLGYAVLAAVAICAYASRADMPVPFLAAGVYWGGLLLTGLREWRRIVPAVFVIQLGLDVWIYGAPAQIAIIFALTKTLEGLGGVAFLRYGPPLLARRFSNRCGRFLLVAGGGAPMLLSLLPAASRHVLGSEAFWVHCLQWWLVQSSGIVLVAPLLLVVSLIVTTPAYLTKRIPEVAALAALTLTVLVLPVIAHPFKHAATLFLAVPLLFLIATRFGILGAIVGNAVLGTVAIFIIWFGVYNFSNLGSVTENVATLCVFLLANTGASLIIGASTTDRENSVRAAERARDRLRNLAVAAQEAEDDYRKQIAEVLHDDLGQNLALIRLRLDILRGRVNKETATAIEDVRDIVDAAIASGRSITSGVASSTFQGDDLGGALQQMLYSFQTELEISTQFKRSGDLKVDKRLASKLFRCTREILVNVLKHANADIVSVEIHNENGNLRIIVEDNGDGFETLAGRDTGHGAQYGLSGCNNTLESLGGSLELISSPGRGTKVIMTARSEE